MRRSIKSLLSAAALLATTALPACAQPAPANDADPALWVVKDADTTIYLFGTVHVLKPGLSWFDEAVKTAFDKSDTLVLEMVTPPDAQVQQVMLARGVMPPGAPTLTVSLPATKRAAYLKAVGDAGLALAEFDRLKPWLAAITLTMAPLRKLGFDPKQAPEEVLTDAAKAGAKPVQGLETFEQQIGFFDQLSKPAQMSFLTSTVEELPTLGDQIGVMVTDWAKGDPDAVGKLLNENLKDSPEVAKTLLFDRNARWAEWIDARMKQPGTVFIAVGAGHLAGNGSVITRLAEHKLTAERVPY